MGRWRYAGTAFQRNAISPETRTEGQASDAGGVAGVVNQVLLTAAAVVTRALIEGQGPLYRAAGVMRRSARKEVPELGGALSESRLVSGRKLGIAVPDTVAAGQPQPSEPLERQQPVASDQHHQALSSRWRWRWRRRLKEAKPARLNSGMGEGS